VRTKFGYFLLFFGLSLHLSCEITPPSGVQDPESDITVTQLSLAGVSIPEQGEVPAYTVAETAQYIGTISWSGNWQGHVTFAGNKIYTATITLSAKPGYTFVGVGSNAFSISGATSVSNSADTGIVTAIFPRTDDWPTYSIRDRGPSGGWIFYVNPNAATDDWKYLEAWKADSGSFQWKVNNTSSTLATSTAIGTGYSNTYSVITNTAHPAANAVRNATYAGFSDWFLPSRDELSQMHNNLEDWGIGGFANSNFWSSTEATFEKAWLQSFTIGTQYEDFKTENMYVRAVRAF
jgi:hypothetical protein